MVILPDFSFLTACNAHKEKQDSVHILSGISTTPRNLLTSRGNYTERIRIVCDIRKDYQYVRMSFSKAREFSCWSLICEKIRSTAGFHLRSQTEQVDL